MPTAQAPAYIPLSLPNAYRRLTRVEGSVPYSSGATSNPLRIDQTGLLLGLMLTFTGTWVNNSTAPVLLDTNPYGLIKRVLLTASGGLQQVISVPGYHLNVFERAREADYVDAPVFPNTGSTTNKWSFGLVIPVCVRDGDLYGEWSDYLGCIYTGDPEVTVSIQLQFATEAELIASGGAGTLSGTVSVTSFKLDVPTPDTDLNLLQSISWTHRLVAEQEQVAIAGAGALSTLNPLPAAQPRAYIRVLDSVVNNGAHVNGVIASYDANLQDVLDFENNIPEQVWLERQLRRYIAPLPAGNYVLDEGAGNRRDNWLPVGNISLFKLLPTISGVGLTNAQLSRYSEVVEPSPLARKWMQIAAARGAFSGKGG